MVRYLLMIAAAAGLGAQTLQWREGRVHGRDAWVLENGRMRIAILPGGGHLAEIRLTTGDPWKDINPMRVPHYPTIDPHRYDPAQHDARYGADPHRWLSSGYMGHLLCFPIYGPPSAEEARAGLGNHGEAPVVEWRRIKIEKEDDALTLWYGADLPKTQFRVERAVTLRAGQRQVRVREWVENLAAWDRPFQWMQHATFGPPFVEPGKTVLDASATRGRVAEGDPATRSLRPGVEFSWPYGVDWEGKPADVRVMQARPRAGTYAALRLDPQRKEQFFTLFHPAYRVLIGYVFPAEGNPWLADWQENGSNRFKPWDGKVVARGLEFGNSPFAEGLKKAVLRGSLFGAPAYGWIGARERISNEFTVFLEEIPKGFRGVAGARTEGGVVRMSGRP